MDPIVILQSAGVSASKGLDFGPALPFTMGSVGSDSKIRDCASTIASASGFVGACLDRFSGVLLSQNASIQF